MGMAMEAEKPPGSDLRQILNPSSVALEDEAPQP